MFLIFSLRCPYDTLSDTILSTLSFERLFVRVKYKLSNVRLVGDACDFNRLLLYHEINVTCREVN